MKMIRTVNQKQKVIIGRFRNLSRIKFEKYERIIMENRIYAFFFFSTKTFKTKRLFNDCSENDACNSQFDGELVNESPAFFKTTSPFTPFNNNSIKKVNISLSYLSWSHPRKHKGAESVIFV